MPKSLFVLSIESSRSVEILGYFRRVGWAKRRVERLTLGSLEGTGTAPFGEFFVFQEVESSAESMVWRSRERVIRVERRAVVGDGDALHALTSRFGKRTTLLGLFGCRLEARGVLIKALSAFRREIFSMKSDTPELVLCKSGSRAFQVEPIRLP